MSDWEYLYIYIHINFAVNYIYREISLVLVWGKSSDRLTSVVITPSLKIKYLSMWPYISLTFSNVLF